MILVPIEAYVFLSACVLISVSIEAYVFLLACVLISVPTEAYVLLPACRLISVPTEAYVFLGAVVFFLILLIVFFLYLNKKLCFSECGGFPCIDAPPKKDSKTKLGKKITACSTPGCL